MEKDYIGFEDIKSLLHIPDVSLFQVYLREVYKDLSDRAESNRKQGISKITFMEYMKLPVFICEKLFAALDVDNDQFLSVKEFTEGLFNLYNGNFEETSDLIFKMLDFNKDGLISKGDIKILLSYIPVKNQNVSEYKYQLECLDEIEEIIKETFGNNQTLTYSEFLNHTQHKKSDVYVQLLCFLYVFKPFTEDNIKTYQSFKRKGESQPSSPSGKVSEVKMPSPSRKSRLLPAEILNMQLDESMSATDSPRKDLSPYKKSLKINPMDLFVRMSNTRVVEKKDSLNNMKIEELIKTSKNVYDSLKRSTNAAESFVEVIREAISNAIKHGGATEIEVTARLEKGLIGLQVLNNGKAPTKKEASTGYGTQILTELALGWTLDVTADGRVLFIAEIVTEA